MITVPQKKNKYIPLKNPARVGTMVQMFKIWKQHCTHDVIVECGTGIFVCNIQDLRPQFQKFLRSLQKIIENTYRYLAFKKTS